MIVEEPWTGTFSWNPFEGGDCPFSSCVPPERGVCGFAVVHQGSAHCSLRAECGSHSVVWKFYRNTAALTCRCIVFGCFCSGTSGLSSWGRNRIMPAELKYLFFYPLLTPAPSSTPRSSFLHSFSCSTSLFKTTSFWVCWITLPHSFLPVAVCHPPGYLSAAVIPVLVLVFISTASLTSPSLTSSH